MDWGDGEVEVVVKGQLGSQSASYNRWRCGVDGMGDGGERLKGNG
jgi:hypothetical protein